LEGKRISGASRLAINRNRAFVKKFQDSCGWSFCMPKGNWFKRFNKNGNRR